MKEIEIKSTRIWEFTNGFTHTIIESTNEAPLHINPIIYIRHITVGGIVTDLEKFKTDASTLETILKILKEIRENN